MKSHLKLRSKQLISACLWAGVFTLVCMCKPVFATPLQDLEASVAAEDATTQVQLDRINAERKVLNARYAEDDKACFQKFAVTPCRNELRAERRLKLDALRKEEVELNDAKRHRRSQLQREQVRQRELDAAERRADTARDAAEKAARQPNEPLGSQGKPRAEPTPRQPPKPTPPHVRQPPAPVDHAAQSAEERARYEQKQKDAAEHKAEIERRNAERDPSKAPKPLPAPP